MTKKRGRPFKISDAEILRANSFGLSLQEIGNMAGITRPAISQRLKAMGIPAFDTRRSFMNEVIRRLPEVAFKHIDKTLSPTFTAKDYIVKLIMDDVLRNQGNP